MFQEREIKRQQTAMIKEQVNQSLVTVRTLVTASSVVMAVCVACGVKCDYYILDNQLSTLNKVGKTFIDNILVPNIDTVGTR